jgi:hypothetical protein
MTAISWLCRPRLGFALAADGNGGYVAEAAEDENNLRPADTKEQKIFVTQFKGLDIAYAFTWNAFNEDRTFSLVQASKAAFSQIAKSTVQNLHQYIDEFSRHIKIAIDNAKSDRRLQRYVGNPHCHVPSEANVFARVFFAGYFRKQPSLAILTLRHENQLLLDPELQIETPPENDYLVGAGEIAARVYGSEDHWVRAHAKPIPPDGSLDDLASLAEGFIRACSDPRAQEVDPSCKGIGGHVQVAELTPSGFKWRIPPIEKETAA